MVSAHWGARAGPSHERIEPGAIHVPVPKPTDEGNRCDLRVEDAQTALQATTAGIGGVGLAPTGGVFFGVEFGSPGTGTSTAYRQSRQTAAADWRSFSNVQVIWSDGGMELPGQATRNVSSRVARAGSVRAYSTRPPAERD